MRFSNQHYAPPKSGCSHMLDELGALPAIDLALYYLLRYQRTQCLGPSALACLDDDPLFDKVYSSHNRLSAFDFSVGTGFRENCPVYFRDDLTGGFHECMDFTQLTFSFNNLSVNDCTYHVLGVV